MVSYIEEFLLGCDTCRSVDCVLVKLSSAIYAIRDIAKSLPTGGLSEEEIVEEFLNHPDVMRVLAGLAGSIDSVRSKIEVDVRFRDLRPYLDMIIASIERASRESRPLREYIDYVRPPTWRIEREEITAKPVMESRKMMWAGSANRLARRSTKPSLTSTGVGREGRGRRRAVVAVAVLAVVGILLFVASSVLPQQLFPLGSIANLLTHVLKPSSGTSPEGGEGSSSAYTVPGKTKTMSPESRQRANVIRLGSTELALKNRHLVIRYWGKWLPYLWLDVGSHTIYLTPYVTDEPDSVTADYVFVNSTYSEATYPLNKLLAVIRNYYVAGETISIDVLPASRACGLRLDSGRPILTGCVEESFIVFNSSGKSLLSVVMGSINETTINYLRSHLFRAHPPKGLNKVAWFILSWLDRNAKYDYVKASMTSLVGVYDPITFFNLREGVCADYAVFTVAALLAGGAKHAYIVLLDTSKGPHAVAGVTINGTLFMLDQKLPVYEWADYVEYVFKPVGNVMQVINVSLDRDGEASIEARLVSPKAFTEAHPDTYPSDRPPHALVLGAALRLAKKLHVGLTSACGYRLYYVFNLGEWKALRAYSPAFKEGFAEYIVSNVLKLLGLKSRYVTCVWSNGQVIYVYMNA